MFLVLGFSSLQAASSNRAERVRFSENVERIKYSFDVRVLMISFWQQLVKIVSDGAESQGLRAYCGIRIRVYG